MGGGTVRIFLKSLIVMFSFFSSSTSFASEHEYEVYLLSILFPSFYSNGKINSNPVDLSDKLDTAKSLAGAYPVKSSIISPVPAGLDFKNTITSGTGMTMVLSNPIIGKVPVVLNAASSDKILVFDAYKRAFYMAKTRGANSSSLSLILDKAFQSNATAGASKAMASGEVYLAEVAQLASLDSSALTMANKFRLEDKIKADPKCGNALGEIKINNEKYYFKYSLIIGADKSGEMPCRGLFTDGESKFDFAGTLKASCQNGIVNINLNNCGVMTAAGGNTSSCNTLHAKNGYWALKSNANGELTTEAKCVATVCDDGYQLKAGQCLTNNKLRCLSVDSGNVTCLHPLMQYAVQSSPDLIKIVNNHTGYGISKDPGWCAPTAAGMVHTAFVRERKQYTNIGVSPAIIPADTSYGFQQKYELIYDYMRSMGTEIKAGGTPMLVLRNLSNGNTQRSGSIGGMENMMGKQYVTYNVNNNDFKAAVFSATNVMSASALKSTGKGFGINESQSVRENLFLKTMPVGVVEDNTHAFAVMGLEFSRYLKLKDPWVGVYDVDIGDDHQGMVFAFGNDTQFDTSISELETQKNGYSKNLLSISVTGYVNIEN